MAGNYLKAIWTLTLIIKQSIKIRGDVMSMRGEIISKEYQRMVFVHDKEGKEYACYLGDLKNLKGGEELTEKEREKCMDLSLVLGDSW